MTHQEGSALAEFIKDHDTRYEAKAMTDDAEAYVLLTQPEDGTQFDPVYTIESYGHQYIERVDPGPTIRTAWDR